LPEREPPWASAGLIFFFLDSGGVPGPVTRVTPVDTSDRLSEAEVLVVLREDWWAGAGPFPAIYFGATDGGDAALADPPERFRPIGKLGD
jgi:hypothetical protein